MRHWTGSSLVHVMACRLFVLKSLPEPMLAYCRMNSWERISMKFASKFHHFHSKKCIWNCHMSKWQPFCPGIDELKIHNKMYNNGLFFNTSPTAPSSFPTFQSIPPPPPTSKISIITIIWVLKQNSKKVWLKVLLLFGILSKIGFICINHDN